MKSPGVVRKRGWTSSSRQLVGRVAQKAGGKLALRDYVAIYVSLLLSLVNFLVVFHGFFFGPSVIIPAIPNITLIHQGCYKEYHFSEIVIPITFANDSISAKNGIVNSAFSILRYGSPERKIKYRAESSVSVGGNDIGGSYAPISDVLSNNRAYSEVERPVFCRNDGLYFRSRVFKFLPDMIDTMAVEQGKVKAVTVKFSPLSESDGNLITLTDVASLLVAESKMKAARFVLEYKVVNDGFIDRALGPIQTVECRLKFHPLLYSTYMLQGWVDVQLEDCS